MCSLSCAATHAQAYRCTGTNTHLTGNSRTILVAHTAHLHALTSKDTGVCVFAHLLSTGRCAPSHARHQKLPPYARICLMCTMLSVFPWMPAHTSFSCSLTTHLHRCTLVGCLLTWCRQCPLQSCLPACTPSTP